MRNGGSYIPVFTVVSPNFSDLDLSHFCGETVSSRKLKRNFLLNSENTHTHLPLFWGILSFTVRTFLQYYTKRKGDPTLVHIIQLFGQLLSDIWFIWQGRADIEWSISWAQYRFSLPNKSDIGQAADETTVLLFPHRMLILLVIRGNYFKSQTSSSCTTVQK